MSTDLRSKANLRRRHGGRRKTPVILQMESTECGAACLGMILAYHGRRMSLEKLRVLCGVSRDGSKAARMLRAARECGLLAGGFHSEPHQLFDLPFPLIVYWNFDHFLVVEGIRKDRVWVVDPASGPRRMSLEEFDRGFTGVCLAFAPGPEWRAGGRAPGAGRRLASHLGRTSSALGFALLATAALAVPGLAVAALIRVFIDGVLIPGDGTWVVPVLLGLALAAVVQAGLTWLQQTCLARIEIRVSVVMTTRFLEHVVSLPLAFFGQRFIGDITARIGSNDRVARLLSGELVGSALGLLTMVLYAGAMLTYDAGLTLIAVGLALANLAALRGVSRTRENAARLLLKERGKGDGVALNGLGMIETLKAGGEEGQFFSRWSGLYANALAAQQDLTRVTGLLNVVPPFLLSLGTVAILGVGGLRVLDGGLSLGGLVAFLTLTTSFLAPVNRLVGLGASLQTVRGDLARLDDVLRYEPDARAALALLGPPSDPPPAARGVVVFDNVTFGYNPHEPPLIENLSFSIASGQRVALVGGSGSGKSTVARLVAGLLRPWSGVVSIDGRPVADIPPSHFAALVSHVDQEVVLFQGTVRDNVTLWNPMIDERQVTRALRDTGVYDEVMSRPGKYDAPVEENGRNFSGGQRQRLALARALAPDPAVLVLDEATAALDTVTEAVIDDHLRRRGSTCLLVAHRLSTVRDADEILVLQDGRVAQRGTHERLMAGDEGRYRSLVASN
ncbi:MAG: NHLP family bacteriocin export ABC transporter peptidase/permease/ATPase subunit [Acidobacteria bacterium]|nr:NHLP family bacteriocin export ABC transporter peptidase/permease/ATPase subunit [Acidobacteriota bacterium]